MGVKTSSKVSVTLATGVGAFAGYGLLHLHDLGLPPWSAWLLGGALTAAASLVHLYQDPEPAKDPAP